MANDEIIQYYDYLIKLATSKCNSQNDAEDLVHGRLAALLGQADGGKDSGAQADAGSEEWDEEQEEWYFSIVDVVGVLAESSDYEAARNYWKVTKHRMIKEGNELVTNCNYIVGEKILLISYMYK